LFLLLSQLTTTFLTLSKESFANRAEKLLPKGSNRQQFFGALTDFYINLLLEDEPKSATSNKFKAKKDQQIMIFHYSIPTFFKQLYSHWPDEHEPLEVFYLSLVCKFKIYML
jgi:hypothetical protein